METLSNYKYVYRVDSKDIICFVDQDWLKFAQENDAACLTADRVIGTQLWTYIDGVETRELYQKLFSRLRTNGGMTIIPYRCYSPKMYRSYDFDIYALAINAFDDGRLEIKSSIVKFESCQYPLLIAKHPRTKEAYRICCFCKSVQFPNGKWSTLEHVFIRICFKTQILLKLMNVICPICKQSIVRRPK
jgi:hypothetical protein